MNNGTMISETGTMIAADGSISAKNVKVMDFGSWIAIGCFKFYKYEIKITSHTISHCDGWELRMDSIISNAHTA